MESLSNPISGKRLAELEGPYRFLSREEAEALIVEAGEGLPVGNGHLPDVSKRLHHPWPTYWLP